MKVSIVTISYNQARFLEQAVLSVLEQDYPNIEYIVVDPGSTDQSREIIRKYSDRITTVIFESDQGAADGLNKGFLRASGDIYGYLNSDDFLLPGAVSHIVGCFQQKTFLDVVSGHALIVNEFGDVIRRFYSDRYDLTSSAYGASILVQPSSFFRSNSYKKTNGFNINNHTNWDDELFSDIKLQNGSFGLTKEFLSAYRIHAASITGAANENLHAAIKNYAAYRFRKIMGRRPQWYDNGVRWFFRLKKYFFTPLNVYERLLHGPIYQRYGSN